MGDPADAPLFTKEELERFKSLPEEDVQEIIDAIKDGASTPAEAMGVRPETLNSIENTALNFYRAKDHGSAATTYAYLLQFDPKRGGAWRGLGACCQCFGMMQAATACYIRAYQLDPEDVPSRVYWAECLLYAKETETALELLGQIVKAGTSNKRYASYIVRAKALLAAQGEKPTRIQLMHQGKALAEDAADQLTQQAVQSGAEITWDHIKDLPDLKKAVEDLSVALNEGRITLAEIGGFTEKELDGAYACACKYAEMGQVMEAIQIAGYLMFLDPNNARYYQLVGISLHRAKQYKNAEHYYRMALLMDPEDPLTIIYRGEAMTLSGKVDEGLEILAQGLEKAGTSPEHHELRKRGEILRQRYRK
jgi:tetratricopeptide (TPR) repeat protein